MQDEEFQMLKSGLSRQKTTLNYVWRLMKLKKISLLLILGILLTSLNIYADTDCTLFYDKEGSSVSITGKIGENEGTGFTVSVSGADIALPFTAEQMPLIMYPYQTQAGGLAQVKIILPGGMEAGKYNVYIDAEQYHKTLSFLHVVDDNPLAQEILQKLNQAENAEEFVQIASGDNARHIGIDIDDTQVKPYLTYALEVCYKQRQYQADGKYSLDSFMAVFQGALGCAVMGIENDAELAMTLYAQRFGTTPEEYLAIEKKTRDEFNSLLCANAFADGKLEDIYSELLLLAQVKTVSAWGYLKEIIMANSEILRIDITESSQYEAIKDSEKYKVFTAMFAKRGTFSDLEDIKDSFNDNVKKVLNEGEPRQGAGANTGSGAKGSAVTGSAQVRVPIEGEAPIAEDTKLFSDITGHFGETAVTRLASMNVISGYPDGSFRPDAPVSRGEFCKMLVTLFELPENNMLTFDDVLERDWYFKYVNALAALGAVEGYGGKFLPDNCIRRQDAAVIIYRLFQYMEVPLEGMSEFVDSGKISSYATTAVSGLAAEGIIVGNDGIFRPHDTITRAETALILSRVYDALVEKMEN